MNGQLNRLIKMKTLTNKKTRRKKCDICGELKSKEDVTYTINPYEEDVKGKIVRQKICSECNNELLSDI